MSHSAGGKVFPMGPAIVSLGGWKCVCTIIGHDMHLILHHLIFIALIFAYALFITSMIIIWYSRAYGG